MAIERCQYMSINPGNRIMPLPSQLATLEELTQYKFDYWKRFVLVQMSVSSLIKKLEELEGFFDKRRVRSYQVMLFMNEMTCAEERVMVAIMCCSRMTDAVEADELGLLQALKPILDDLNMERSRLCINALSAEARAEEASRESRKAAREVHADVQRSRKALQLIRQAGIKVRNGSIKKEQFPQLAQQLNAYVDAAHEEYRSAVMDSRPVNEYTSEAVRWMEAAEVCNKVMEQDLGSGVFERKGVVDYNSEEDEFNPHAKALNQKRHEIAIVQDAIEVAIQVVQNAYNLANRAADNARNDLQSILDEVVKAEKIIKMVEIEERRVKNLCDTVCGEIPDEDLPEGCIFAKWTAPMRKLNEKELSIFIKETQYRSHLPEQEYRSTEDTVMMTSMLAQVQIINDLKKLREKKAEEVKRKEMEEIQQKSSKAPKKDPAEDLDEDPPPTEEVEALKISSPSSQKLDDTMTIKTRSSEDALLSPESTISSSSSEEDSSDQDGTGSIAAKSVGNSLHQLNGGDNYASVTHKHQLKKRNRKKKKDQKEEQVRVKKHEEMRSMLICDAIGKGPGVGKNQESKVKFENEKVSPIQSPRSGAWADSKLEISTQFKVYEKSSLSKENLHSESSDEDHPQGNNRKR